ncbi:Hypothetical predicted protein [Pelobates cultripes]|uniref:Uncharacterized protein n=1 Tax=Pelobates cultripes TaxID=61616 RepID=A0AAD1R5K8_PELCU|nr:Hypothetical predicted protein [Pelobates cultripes]
MSSGLDSENLGCSTWGPPRLSKAKPEYRHDNIQPWAWDFWGVRTTSPFARACKLKACNHLQNSSTALHRHTSIPSDIHNYDTSISSVSTMYQETNYRLLSPWYCTPYYLHKVFPTIPKTCWRCVEVEGMVRHIWWDCPRVTPYWESVGTKIMEIMGETPPFEIDHVLIHATQSPLATYKKIYL